MNIPTDQKHEGGSEGSGDFRPIPVPANRAEEIAMKTGLPVEQINPFVVLYAGQPYITKAGLTFKADGRYGVGAYRVISRFPTMQEYEMALHMMRWSKEEPIVIMITEFYVDGKPDPLYSNIGTASRKNCSMIKEVNNCDKRGLEIATTRSQNRTLRQATNSGFVPIDEVYDGDDEPTAPTPKNVPENGGGPYGGFLKRCGELKRDLEKQGRQKEYYATLELYGKAHANEVQPGDLDRQMDILVALGTLGAMPPRARERAETMYGRPADAEFKEAPETAHQQPQVPTPPSDPSPSPNAQPTPEGGTALGNGSAPVIYEKFIDQMKNYESILGTEAYKKVLGEFGFKSRANVNPKDGAKQLEIIGAMEKAVNTNVAA